jgi:Domain of unknown function (DUF929)
MSEPDDADVIEQSPRHQFNLPAVPGLPALRGVVGTGLRRVVIIAAACALVMAAGGVAAFRLTQGPRADPALTRLVAEVTSVPVGTSVPVLGVPAPPAGGFSGLLVASDTLKTVNGPPLTAGGKPEVLYIGTGYCPYCAMENWPLIVALSRFGQFTGLTTSRSPEFEHIAPVDSWTFYGSHYTSPYLAFVPVEQYSNVLVNAAADPGQRASYRKLQSLTPAQQATLAKYDKSRATPYLDFGDREVQVGSGSIAPGLMTGKSWPQLAAALRQPKTALGSALLTEADLLTAGLCHLTGDRPAAACPAFLQNVSFSH